MAKFSKTSIERLSTCHIDLRTIFYEAVREYDCSILEGHRGEERQNNLYKKKLSKLQYPFGKHNKQPSEAVDVAPYPIDFADSTKKIARFYHFAGYILGLTERLLLERKITHNIRWGGDWDGDRDFSDQNFDDLGHFELI